ncbi:MAG TPA: YIP1 family protein [Longimicrobiales bacterium]|nr:YIP1 family protein [Longimicrobiales bacterium]
METIAGTRSFGQRMKDAAMLDPGLYEEVEHDASATGQAAGVVAIVAVCAAIGQAGAGIGGIVGAAAGALIGWLVLAGIVYLVGDKIFGGTATWGEMLRTMGFAQAPGVLYILGIIPLLGGLIAFVVWLWILVAVVVAIRQGLDVGTGKAVATGVLAWIGYVLVAGALGFLF